jgi:predicted  nucleic acid-binding Zn-ribbon protein
MADPDRLSNLKEKVARLENQLTRSEKMLDDVLKQLKASRASAQKQSKEKTAKLEKDLEDQREEFEALIGRMNEELQAVQKERDELVLELEKSRPKKKRPRAAFEDEATSTYSHQEMKDVVKREMFVAEEEPFFEDEEVTASHTPSQPPGNKDQET